MKILDAVKKEINEHLICWLFVGYGWLFVMVMGMGDVAAIPDILILKALLMNAGMTMMNLGLLIRTNDHLANTRRKLDKLIEEDDCSE